jgi:plastocyanin
MIQSRFNRLNNRRPSILAITSSTEVDMSRRAKVLGLGLALVVAAAPLAQAADHVVEMVGISFVPPFLNIDIGDKVIWKNASTLVHTATSGLPCTPSGLFDSGFLGPAQEYSFTFTAQGIIPYFCNPHCGLGMTGQITVTGAVPTEHKTWGAIKELYKINR